MKRIIYILYITVITVSCVKKKSDKVPLPKGKLEGTWHFAGGDEDFEDYGCEVDDIWNFKSNAILEIQSGNLKCDEDDKDYSVNYKLSSDEQFLILNYSNIFGGIDTLKVLILKSDTLKIADKDSYVDYRIYTKK